MKLTITLASFLAPVSVTIGLGLLLMSAYAKTQAVSSRSPWIADTPLGAMLKILVRLNLHPQLETLRAQITQKLLFAGQPGALNAAEYLSLVEWSGMATFLLVALLLLWSGVGTLALCFIGLLLSVTVAWLVYAWLDHMVTERRLQISRQFPYFLDGAVMSMEAGSSFEQVVEIYVQDNAQDALAEELRFMLKEVHLGKRRNEALLALRNRLAAEEVRNAISATVQGTRAGTRLGDILRGQADAIRFKRSQLAERAAEELKIRLMGPTVLMMIAIFLLILGPVFINIVTSGIV